MLVGLVWRSRGPAHEPCRIGMAQWALLHTEPMSVAC